VVTPGETTIEALVLPVLQLNVTPSLTVNTALFPVQMLRDPVMVGLGGGTMVRVMLSTDVHGPPVVVAVSVTVPALTSEALGIYVVKGAVVLVNVPEPEEVQMMPEATVYVQVKAAFIPAQIAWSGPA
jgi:hypothetical protein